MNHAEFIVGERVYYHYPPSGGERKWYGYVTHVKYEWGAWTYKIQFDNIDTPQLYSNTSETTLIFSEKQPEPTWEV